MLKINNLVGFGVGGGAPAFKSASSYNNASITTSHNVTMPATFSAGDLLILSLAHQQNATVSSLTGWTSLLNATNRSIYYKVATGGDTCSVTLTSSGSQASGGVAAYGPYRAIDGTPTTGIAFGDVTLGAVTTTNANALLIAVASLNCSPFTSMATPSGFTLDASAEYTQRFAFFYSKVLTSAGSTGSVLLDVTASAPALGGALIAIT